MSELYRVRDYADDELAVHAVTDGSVVIRADSVRLTPDQIGDLAAALERHRLVDEARRAPTRGRRSTGRHERPCLLAGAPIRPANTGDCDCT